MILKEGLNFVAPNIARRQKISKRKAFTRFMKSKTVEMLFDESTYMWMNGSDYIADEYRIEKKMSSCGQYERHGKKSEL